MNIRSHPMNNLGSIRIQIDLHIKKKKERKNIKN